MSETHKQKLKVGWFSFTCCEDNSIVFTELLNDHFFAWREKLDFTYIKLLRSENSFDSLDIAFVEGAISSCSQEEKLKEIRQKAKKLVAVGACAISGLPATQRNTFDSKTQAEIQVVLDRFNYKNKAAILAEIVPVDKEIPGCPMEEENFVKTLDELVDELT